MLTIITTGRATAAAHLIKGVRYAERHPDRASLLSCPRWIISTLRNCNLSGESAFKGGCMIPQLKAQICKQLRGGYVFLSHLKVGVSNEVLMKAALLMPKQNRALKAKALPNMG